MNEPKDCPHCKGDGADPDDEGEWFPEVQMHNPNMRAPCPVCHGTGTNPAV
jgi:DnaJ-class molecular chaperone